MNSTPGPETRIGQAIRKKLEAKAKRLEVGFKAIKLHANEFTEEGTPDLLICISGQQVMIETKTPDGRLDPIQTLRIRQWREAGATAGVCTGVEEAFLLTDEVFKTAVMARNIRDGEYHRKGFEEEGWE